MIRIANTSTSAECSTTGFSQSACGYVIEFTDILAKYSINTTATTKGGCPGSAIYKLVNGTDETLYSANTTDSSTKSSVKSIYMSLPEELRNVIIDTTVISSHGTADSANFTSTDKLYLLSTAEVWAQGTSNTIGNDTARDVTRQLDYYLNQKVTTSSYSAAKKQYNGSATTWLLRSAASSGDGSYYRVNSNGNWHDNYATTTCGVSPSFRIG